jgi:hypothetical protein
MENFGLVKSKKIWKNKKSVEELDYSILLTHVFGRPIRGEQAFMYLYRRYGPPQTPFDDYKELCSYTFFTNIDGIIVRWRIIDGDYHHHLCAFTDYKEWAYYAVKPQWNWNKAIKEMAEKEGKAYFGGSAFRSVYKERKDGKTVFTGNEIQRKSIDNFLKDYTSEDKDVWHKLYDWMMENDRAIRDLYRSNLPFPQIESQYGKPFSCQFNNQIEAGEKQHEWVMSLPEDHFLRRVYFAATALFEDWKRPTYIRDCYFNLTCESTPYGSDDAVEYAVCNDRGRNV